MSERPTPTLITFDGEARSGKGTIVHFIKDYLRDECGYKPMLIDAGQVFRVLVVAGMRAEIEFDDDDAIDTFLSDEANIEACVQLVKDVYRMSKQERDALLYTSEVGVNSAKVGARPQSQTFKDMLLRKWLVDARKEGFDVVLLDGRALEEVGTQLADERLCNYLLGLYFTCDAKIGALRTLGFAQVSYDNLDNAQKKAVDELVQQITERNQKDQERLVQPVLPPRGAMTYDLPTMPSESNSLQLPEMIIFDTSAKLSKDAMSQPIAKFVASCLAR